MDLQIQPGKRYTYAEYETWGEHPRYELIDGIPCLMASPTVGHQRLLGELFYQLRTFLRGKPCEPFMAPLDVRLNPEDADDTIVQPDIFVVCDRSKLEDGKSCVGAPDFVIEVLSPSNSRHEMMVKLEKYLQAGVREYWIVDPNGQRLVTHRRENSHYNTQIYGPGGEVPVGVLNGCKIDLRAVFG